MPIDREEPGEHLSRLQAELAALDAQRAELTDRIRDLREGLGRGGAETQVSETSFQSPFSASQKVALFKERFRGRTDVFARKWTNARKGTAGYAPACENEWVAGVCGKPQVKCGSCPNQAFLRVSNDVIRDHLQGRQVVGVYPMLEDETCWFLAADFDKEGWQEDVAAFVETCRSHGVDVGVERSQSGQGAHVWIFFEEPIAARVARELGCFLLTETMGRRHQLPMTSYDRLFPSQDTMPKGGFGNLIGLPFQGQAQKAGNTLFVDDAWRPIADQWGFLASIRRMPPGRVAELARRAVDQDMVIAAQSDDDEGSRTPWIRSSGGGRTIVGPHPKQVNAVFGQLLFVETTGLSSSLITQIRRLAAFQNPEFFRKQQLRLSTALTPRVISCAEEHPLHLGLPRGCLSDLKELLEGLGVALSVTDRRTLGQPLDARFHGQLTSVQEAAASAMLKQDQGVFVAPPGAGKTVVGANLIVSRGRGTLVIVHRTQLLEQWVAQLSAFLGCGPKDIGQIGAGKRRITGRLDIAMLQSLVRRNEVDEVVGSYGHVLVDECHHVPAVSFERVMREVRATYVTGLTATPRRRDGHHPILRLQLGPILHRISARSMADEQAFRHRLVVRETDFRLRDRDSAPVIQDLYKELADNDPRNQLILNDILQALEEGRSPLVLTERRDHLAHLAGHLGRRVSNLIVLQGGMKTKDRKKEIDRLTSIPPTEHKVVLATGRFIGEGFDDARLDTLFLALPVSWRGTLVQYAGRLHRSYPEKTEVRLVDYVDPEVPMLARMFRKRLRGYEAMGYSRDAGVAEGLGLFAGLE